MYIRIRISHRLARLAQVEIPQDGSGMYQTMFVRCNHVFKINYVLIREVGWFMQFRLILVPMMVHLLFNPSAFSSYATT